MVHGHYGYIRKDERRDQTQMFNTFLSNVRGNAKISRIDKSCKQAHWVGSNRSPDLGQKQNCNYATRYCDLGPPLPWSTFPSGRHSQQWRAEGGADGATVPAQSALEFCPILCPNGRLGQDLGFGGSAFALKLPELLNRNLVAVRAKLGQTSCLPNGPQIWCPIGQ